MNTNTEQQEDASLEQEYPSQQQAYLACRDWAEKGEELKYKQAINLDGSSSYTYEGRWRDESASSRACKLEGVTRQYLGSQGKFSKEDREMAGQIVEYPYFPQAGGYIVVKHFRY